MENLWSVLVSAQIMDTMRLLGSDEKYINGAASDFECFREWLSAYPLLNGNSVAEQFLHELEKTLGHSIDCFDAAPAWREYNAKKYGFEYTERYVEKSNYIFSGYKKTYSDEKNKKTLNLLSINHVLSFDVTCLDDATKHMVKSNINSIYAFFHTSDFAYPNRYAAECAIKKIVNGEKCNKDELNQLLSQIICEYIYLKNGEKIQLYLDTESNLSYARELIKYLSLRGLSARVYICVNDKHDASDIKDTCACAFGKCFATPVAIGERYSESAVNELARIYPIGLFDKIDLRLVAQNQ